MPRRMKGVRNGKRKDKRHVSQPKAIGWRASHSKVAGDSNPACPQHDLITPGTALSYQQKRRLSALRAAGEERSVRDLLAAADL